MLAEKHSKERNEKVLFWSDMRDDCLWYNLMLEDRKKGFLKKTKKRRTE